MLLREFIQQSGLYLVYPKEYAGTEDEKKLMEVLDEAAGSFEQEWKEAG